MKFNFRSLWWIQSNVRSQLNYFLSILGIIFLYWWWSDQTWGHIGSSSFSRPTLQTYWTALLVVQATAGAQNLSTVKHVSNISLLHFLCAFHQMYLNLYASCSNPHFTILVPQWQRHPALHVEWIAATRQTVGHYSVVTPCVPLDVWDQKQASVMWVSSLQQNICLSYSKSG